MFYYVGICCERIVCILTSYLFEVDLDIVWLHVYNQVRWTGLIVVVVLYEIHCRETWGLVLLQ